MASIKIHNWKVADKDDTNTLVFVPPEYHPTYWEVPKWWYKGDRTVYTSCVRVDLNDETSIYIDGTTPLMQLTIDFDGDDLRGSDWRDIRRVLVCAKGDLGAINRGESDAYDDVEFFKDYYITRVNNYAPKVIDPLIAELKPTFYSELPVSAGSTSPFDTGTWHGGVEPVTYEWRHKAQDYQSDVWYSVGDWKAQPNEAIQETISLADGSNAWYIHIESRAVDAEGTTVYNNSAVRRAIPRVQKEPGGSIKYADFNTYEEGSEIVFQTATFYGGVPPVQYRYRIQQRETSEDSWDNGSWTQYDNTVQDARETITFPAGSTARVQCQAVDSSQGSAKSAQSSGSQKTIVAPPPVTNWGAIIVYVNDVEYNYFVGAPVEVVVGEPINMKVEWEGDATGTVEWSQRAGGSAFIDDPQNPEPEITMTGPGSTFITVTLNDPDGYADPNPSDSKAINFWASPA